MEFKRLSVCQGFQTSMEKLNTLHQGFKLRNFRIKFIHEVHSSLLLNHIGEGYPKFPSEEDYTKGLLG